MTTPGAMPSSSTYSSNAQPPTISIVFLAYNQESMVERAALSCLAQEGGPYEIVLSDDASTDGTYSVLQAVAAAYRGPHKVAVRRNAVNVGIGEHYNQLLDATAGELLITAAGDDFSLPHRTARIAAAWEATGKRADLIASHVIDLDHDGVLHDIIEVDDLAPYRNVDEWLTDRPYIIGAGHAFTRRMMKRFGPMGRGVFYEDQIMVFRAIASGGAITIDEPLVHYRRGGTSAKPEFESVAHMQRWRDRQTGRELAEMEQLISDADLAGCGDKVRAQYERTLLRTRYLRNLSKVQSASQGWTFFRQERKLPLAWRFRKLLHVLFPNATYVVKRSLSIFQRRRHY